MLAINVRRAKFLAHLLCSILAGIGTLFGVLSLRTIRNIVSSLGLDQRQNL